MPKIEKSLEAQLNDAMKDYSDAMTENILASKAETEVKIRRKKAHNNLLIAKGILSGLERELMSYDYLREG